MAQVIKITDINVGDNGNLITLFGEVNGFSTHVHLTKAQLFGVSGDIRGPDAALAMIAAIWQERNLSIAQILNKTFTIDFSAVNPITAV